MLHKLFLLIIKYVPVITAIIYFICCVLGCFQIKTIILPNIFFLSPISALFIICASFTFKFCIWHRLPIYYSLVLQIINIIDYYSPVVFTNNVMLFIYLLITMFFILLGMYFKNKYNADKENKN